MAALCEPGKRKKMKPLLFVLIAIFISSCAGTNETARFDNINADEITAESLRPGSRIDLLLEDESTIKLTVAEVDDLYIYSVKSAKIEKSKIKSMTVLSWAELDANQGA